MPMAVCASHTPLMKAGPVEPDVRRRVEAAFAQLAGAVRAYEPDCVIQFSPDHFNGFFYDLMPSFCIGAGAESIGDWGGATGPLPVDEAFALEILDAVRAADVDAALSYRMMLDHGFVQLWEASLGRYDPYPIVPIFINSAAPPVPTYRRARMLGEVVGRCARASGRRILYAASGGLSHDPPMPEIAGAPPEVRARLIDGRNPSAAAREMRESRVLEAGRLAVIGEGPCQPLDPDWDRAFLAALRAGDMSKLDDYNPLEVRRVAGRGGNEVLAWVAAIAALSTHGGYDVLDEYYEAIPGWVAGMATFVAETR
jgi:2,3-dihydroxyphenylpropionate 1,2-dioxygenase